MSGLERSMWMVLKSEQRVGKKIETVSQHSVESESVQRKLNRGLWVANNNFDFHLETKGKSL